jgi:hypothetical protein
MLRGNEHQMIGVEVKSLDWETSPTGWSVAYREKHGQRFFPQTQTGDMEISGFGLVSAC